MGEERAQREEREAIARCERRAHAPQSATGLANNLSGAAAAHTAARAPAATSPPQLMSSPSSLPAWSTSCFFARLFVFFFCWLSWAKKKVRNTQRSCKRYKLTCHVCVRKRPASGEKIHAIPELGWLGPHSSFSVAFLFFKCLLGCYGSWARGGCKEEKTHKHN